MQQDQLARPPFFIVGVGRSGTTLLRLMFQSHPNIAIPYESHFLTKYHSRLSEYGDLNSDDNLRKLINDILSEDLLKKWDHSFSVDTIFPMIGSRTLGSVIRAIYDDYQKGKQKLRWGDKSDYLDRLHVINEMFPDALFIHIIRDGRDVANSVLKLPWGPSDIIQAAEWWHEHVTVGRRMGAMLEPSRYTEIKFEDLISDTENQMKRLCEFIGEEFSEEVLNYYKNSANAIPESRKAQHYNADSPPKTDRIAAWKKEMPSLNVAIFNDYAKKSLKELNYEIPESKHSKITLTLYKFAIFVKRSFTKKQRRARNG